MLDFSQNMTNKRPEGSKSGAIVLTLTLTPRVSAATST